MCSILSRQPGWLADQSGSPRGQHEVLETEKQDLAELQTAISELKTNLSALDSQEKVLATDLAEWRGKVARLRAGQSRNSYPSSPFSRNSLELLALFMQRNATGRPPSQSIRPPSTLSSRSSSATFAGPSKASRVRSFFYSSITPACV